MVAGDFGLYVHWPWCVRKCPYCDFNSFAGTIEESPYLDAVLKDLAFQAKGLETPVTSVFFGGGTPSLMTESGFDRLMQGIRSLVPLAEDAEVTMEANPGTVETERLHAYAASGVNRFSIGVQSFHEKGLRSLSRIHTGDEAKSAVEAALAAVGNVNIDLMYGWPDETEGELAEDIRTATALGCTHLSCYELTLEPQTAFAKRPPKGLPDADVLADMADLVADETAQAGFIHYEVSGYAKSGRMCRHNRTYWTFGDYLGVGAGAHGKLTQGGKEFRTIRSNAPTVYMRDVEESVIAGQVREVPRDELPFEFMLNVLRLTEGVPASRWEETTRLPLEVLEPTLSRLRSEKLLVADSDRIAASELGRRFLSDVQERFLSAER